MSPTDAVAAVAAAAAALAGLSDLAGSGGTAMRTTWLSIHCSSGWKGGGKRT